MGQSKGPNPFIHSTLDLKAAGPQSQVNPCQSQGLRAEILPLPPSPLSHFLPRVDLESFTPRGQRPLSWGSWSPIQPSAPPYRPAEDRKENQRQVLVNFSLGHHPGKVQERTPTPLPMAPDPAWQCSCSI